jgi:hypothetical protein
VKISNSYQAQAAIEALVLSGTEPDQVYLSVRNETDFPNLREVMGNQSHKDFRAAVEGFANQVVAKRKEAALRGPLVERHIELQHKSGALIGDVMAAMGALELTNPRDIRDAVDLMQQLERLQSAAAAERVIKDCLQFISTKGDAVDLVVELQGRFEELWPLQPDEDDDE